MSGREMFDIWYAKLPEEQKRELELIKDNENEIKERFSIPLAFGTAGMRGEVGIGTFRMNNYTVARATKGLAMFVRSLGAEAMERGVVISYDTRRGSYEFAKTVAKVLSYNKVKSYVFENVHPVPMCSFAVRYLNAIAGVMITASHNPKEYNGYKVYGEDGAQMSPEDTAVVVKYISAIDDYFGVEADDAAFPESIRGLDNYKVNDYITVIGKTVDDEYYAAIEKLSLSPEAVKKYGKDIKLVYTPIHGSGYIPVTTILARMGINVTCVKEQVEPDTEFRTVPVPNPENPGALEMGIELGNRIGADVVIGTDPDCDRMGLAIRDPSGEFRLLNGNQIGALLMDYILTRLKEENKIPANGAVVKTIVTTTLADRIAQNFGVKVFNVLTGFKFIGEKIKEWERTGEYEFIFGYEESYGYLRGIHARDKDAVVASMLTAEMVCYYESKGKGLYQRLMEIFQKYGYYSEEVTSIAYKGVSAMEEMAEAMARMRTKTIKSLSGYEVEFTSDYLKRITAYPDGRTEEITLPKTDAIKYCLKDGQFVCIRPSGTEPKLKVYVLCYDADVESSKEKARDLLKAIKKELQ
ncbi:MAG TPA: phospho-sugar mutase [Clostridia bacterium]|jgi:phosphoglucomutase|nr:phospho-sugar mutase [Clostridia bacterium]